MFRESNLLRTAYFSAEPSRRLLEFYSCRAVGSDGEGQPKVARGEGIRPVPSSFRRRLGGSAWAPDPNAALWFHEITSISAKSIEDIEATSPRKYESDEDEDSPPSFHQRYCDSGCCC